MADANSVVADLIAHAKTNADAAFQETQTLIATAQTVAQGYAGFFANPTITPDAITVPPYSPTVNIAASYKTDFDSEWSSMEGWMRGLMGDYVNTFFPILDPAVQTSENSWLLNVINNGYLGIPVAVETAMWDRARAKDTQDATRMEDEAMTQFSARGFTMPPGVLANRMQMVQQEAANKASTIARDLAIKNTEIAIDMTKFAVTEMTKLRIGIAQALADFMKAWMVLPQVAADIAKTKAEMQRLLWDSSSNYIHALVAKAALGVDAQKSVLHEKVQEDSVFVQNFLGSQKLRVDAAIAGAQEMGRTAAAYANSMNTLGNIGGITSYNG